MYEKGSKKTVADPFLGNVELTCVGEIQRNAMGETTITSVWSHPRFGVWIFNHSTAGDGGEPVVLSREVAELVAQASQHETTQRV